MSAEHFPVETYLERIGLPMLPPPAADGLRALVRAQSERIAFENLDVLAGRPIRLEAMEISDKILGRGRGGYCYELNGLLSGALQSAGFRFERRLARVTYRRPSPGPKTHLVLLVEAEGRSWLVDVGFGGPGLFEPMPFAPEESAIQNESKFRLIDAGDGSLHLQRKVQADRSVPEWTGLYIIAPEAVLPIDVEVVNHFVSTWDRSPFRSLFMCVRPVEGGLLSIQGKDIVRLDHQLRIIESTPLESAQDLGNALRSRFALNVPFDIVERAWLKAVPPPTTKSMTPTPSRASDGHRP